jgi:N utilization substance protein B
MRRIIRIKAMQGLYTYYNNRSVNEDDIRQKAASRLIEIPDFYNATAQEKAGFLALMPVFLDDAFGAGLDIESLPENQKWLGKMARQAFADWNKENEQEIKRIRTSMAQDIRRQTATEVSFWNLFLDLAQEISRTENQKTQRYLDNEPSLPHTLKFAEHPWLPFLEEALHPKKGKVPPASRQWDRETIISLYQTLMVDLTEYQAYRDKPEATPEDHAEIFKVMYRKLFKSERFNETMLEHDLHWSENRILLEVSLKTTYKTLQQGEVPRFEPNAAEEEEYIGFFDTLFDATREHFEEDDAVIREVSVNWDADRLPVLDKWIIHLSVNEMRKFPHIPVKVTINEYLEIAKAYSTPGSAGFINGVVDKMSKRLQQAGKIRKSAKGMMDNK